MSEKHDAIVVGGGLGGLTAARELCRRGHSVVLLEGRDRLGGRLWTREFAGTDVEFGGTFVHWWQPHVFAEMSRFGIPYEPGPSPGHWSWWGDGMLHRDSDMGVIERMTPLFDKVFYDSPEVFPLPTQTLAGAEAFAAADGVTLRSRIDELGLSAEEDDLLTAMLATCCSARTEEVSLAAIMHWYALSGRTFLGTLETCGLFMAKSTGALVDAIAGEVDGEIRLGCPVSSIAQDADGVVVTTREGEEIAGRVAVVALPLNVLDAVELSPAPPPEVQRLIDEKAASHGSKMWIHARGIEEAFYVTAPESEPLNFIDTVYETADGGQIIVAFGNDANSLDPTDTAAVSEAVRRLVPGEYEVVEVGAHDWTNDEFSMGTWAVDRPGQRTAGLAAAQQRQGRVMLAGADFASGWKGFMDGAIESGQNAGRELAALLEG